MRKKKWRKSKAFVKRFVLNANRETTMVITNLFALHANAKVDHLKLKDLDGEIEYFA